jgi:hypothetical protein
VMNTEIMFFWNVMPCSLVHSYRRFFYPEDGGIRFFRNVGVSQITMRHIIETDNINRSIKGDFKEVECEVMDWIHLAQDRNQ